MSLAMKANKNDSKIFHNKLITFKNYSEQIFSVTI